MLIFTSCTINYIPKARILAESVKKQHPDWKFCLLLGEDPFEGFDLTSEPFDRVLLFSELGIPAYKAWLFRHRVVEICTAAKGPALYYFLVHERHEKVIYLDPDICVFNSLEPLSELLDQHDILLTPHQLAPQSGKRAIIDNEICSLQHGVYNLGFVACARRSQGIAFARWWRDRLYDFCYDDIPNGIFTDQRWCDLAPAFFSSLHIVRDPGYNAASWNLTDRVITQNEQGEFFATDRPLRFYHFTGYDSGAGCAMIAVYGKNMPAVTYLWKIYADRLQAFGHEKMGKTVWKYMKFDNGTPITDDMRLLYRNRSDLQQAFPDPFSTAVPFNFCDWYASEIKSQTAEHVVAAQEAKGSWYISYCAKVRRALSLFSYYCQRHGGILPACRRLSAKGMTALMEHGITGCLRKAREFSAFERAVSAQKKDEENHIQKIKEALTQKTALIRSWSEKTQNHVCIIDHQYGGGANAYSNGLTEQWLKEGKGVVRLTWDLHLCKIIGHLISNDFSAKFEAELLDELFEFPFRFETIFVNELVHFSERKESALLAVPPILEKIVKLKEINGARLCFAYHDFYPVCPNYTLYCPEKGFCGIPENLQECDTCSLKKSPDISGDVPQEYRITTWRAAWQAFFDQCDEIRVFSRSTQQLQARCYTLRDDHIVLIPHKPLITWNNKYRIPQDGPMVIGIVGSLSEAKGALIMRDMAKFLKPEQSIVHFGHYHGNCADLSDKIICAGPYRREDLPDLLAWYGVTVGLIPSVCAETFSYTTQECMELGLPLVCFNLGAPAERIGAWEHGLVADAVSAEAAYKALETLDARRFATNNQ